MRRFLILLAGLVLLAGTGPTVLASPPARPCVVTGLPALATGSPLRMESAAVEISVVDEKSPMQVAGKYVVANPTAQPAAEELTLSWEGWEGCAAAPEAAVDGKPAGFRSGVPMQWYFLTLDVPPGGKREVTVTHALPGWSNGPLYSYGLSPARDWGTETLLSVEVRTPWYIGLRTVPHLERRDGAYRLQPAESLPYQLMLYPYRPYRLWSWAVVLVAVPAGGVLWLWLWLRRRRRLKE